MFRFLWRRLQVVQDDCVNSRIHDGRSAPHVVLPPDSSTSQGASGVGGRGPGPQAGSPLDSTSQGASGVGDRGPASNTEGPGLQVWQLQNYFTSTWPFGVGSEGPGSHTSGIGYWVPQAQLPLDLLISGGMFGVGGPGLLAGSPLNFINQGASSVGSRGALYHVRKKDLMQIHKAAVAGDVLRVKLILLLQINDVNARDRMRRTALHLACANGHSRVVKHLARRRCRLDLCDNEHRTALIKAVQCQEEECATLLLERGADPNVMDIYGNTALHYAALGENQALVDKLLAHKANIDATNKDDLTPLSLAKRENKEKMVQLLLTRGARIDQMESNLQQTSETIEERRSKTSSESSKSLEREEKREREKQPCVPDCALSGDQASNLCTLEQCIAQLNSPAQANEDSLSSISIRLDGNDTWPSSDEFFDLEPKKKASDPQNTRNNNNVTDVDGEHKENGDKKSAVGVTAEEDSDSPWDLEGSYESLPEVSTQNFGLKNVIYLPEPADQRGKNILTRQVEDLPAEQDLAVTPHEEQGRLVGGENDHPQDKVFPQTSTLREEAYANQTKQIHLPLCDLQKVSHEPQINSECKRGTTCIYSGLPSVQKEEPLHDDSKEGASERQMPSDLTNKALDCNEKDAFVVSACAVSKMFPEEASLENAFPIHSHPGSLEDASRLPSKLCLSVKELHNENDPNPDTVRVFNKNESFYNDTENKDSVRNPLITFEVKEDQELDMQMTENRDPCTSNEKLGTGHTPQSSDPKRHLELIEIKIQATFPNTYPYTETKPNQDVFQEPSNADSCSASSCKSMEIEFRDAACSPQHNDRTSQVCLSEEVQSDLKMLRKDMDVLKRELALIKEKVQLQKEDEKEQLNKHTELIQSLQYSLDQERKKNDEIETENTRLKELLTITEKKLNEYENEEFSFLGGLKSNLIEMDSQIKPLQNKLQEAMNLCTATLRCAEEMQDHRQRPDTEIDELKAIIKAQTHLLEKLLTNRSPGSLNNDLAAKVETACSKCVSLDEKNEGLQQELLRMKAIMHKKFELFENEKKKLIPVIVEFKQYLDQILVDFTEVKQYKRKIKKRRRRDLVAEMEERNRLLQMQQEFQRILTRRVKDKSEEPSCLKIDTWSLKSVRPYVVPLQDPGNKDILLLGVAETQLHWHVYEAKHFRNVKVKRSVSSLPGNDCAG